MPCEQTIEGLLVACTSPLDQAKRRLDVGGAAVRSVFGHIEGSRPEHLTVSSVNTEVYGATPRRRVNRQRVQSVSGFFRQPV